MNDQKPSVNLTHEETVVLAYRLCIDQLNDADWLLWENVPELSEAGLQQLDKAIGVVCLDLRRTLQGWERRTDTDSVEIKGRVS